MIQVKRKDIAEWAKAQKKLLHAAVAMPMIVDRLAHKEAEFFRKRIVEGLKKQAPAGRAFRPPINPWTLATRRYLGIGGSKLLIARSDLIRGISVWKSGKSYMVGVQPGAVNREGKSLVKIAQLQEEGSPAGGIWLKLTKEMRAVLAIIAKRAGRPLPAKKMLVARPGWIRVDIPARPFIAPVFSKYGWRGALEYRLRGYLSSIAMELFG